MRDGCWGAKSCSGVKLEESSRRGSDSSVPGGRTGSSENLGDGEKGGCGCTCSNVSGPGCGLRRHQTYRLCRNEKQTTGPRAPLQCPVAPGVTELLRRLKCGGYLNTLPLIAEDRHVNRIADVVFVQERVQPAGGFDRFAVDRADDRAQ